ncbi:hypothetical protein GW943_01915 [Candidatus Parcubacteria bacterium]|nr:hypothetical protein [Candidatus Parcubacteria bacterium]
MQEEKQSIPTFIQEALPDASYEEHLDALENVKGLTRILWRMAERIVREREENKKE